SPPVVAISNNDIKAKKLFIFLTPQARNWHQELLHLIVQEYHSDNVPEVLFQYSSLHQYPNHIYHLPLLTHSMEIFPLWLKTNNWYQNSQVVLAGHTHLQDIKVCDLSHALLMF
ncbi:hypothetical protein, partial [Salmonella enterica]|uniref:hypothetical protein n=1 Tax=Salmonella enterica TaxID=28901 RepID=UPI001E42817E